MQMELKTYLEDLKDSLLVMVLHSSEFHSSIGDLINRPKHFCFTIFTKHVLLTDML